MTIAYITHHDCLLHEMGEHHPERPARLRAIHQRLLASGLDGLLDRYDAPVVERALLEQVHDPAYIDAVFAAAPGEGLAWLDGDTAMNPHSLQAALRAAGATALGVDLGVCAVETIEAKRR